MMITKTSRTFQLANNKSNQNKMRPKSRKMSLKLLKSIRKSQKLSLKNQRK